jgi:3-hydroxybutyryl-CoA dehydrogenase
MHLTVIADGITQKEFQDKPIPQGITIYFLTAIDEAHFETDAFFYLDDEEKLITHKLKLEALEKPVFVNAVITTLKDLPSNCIRLNAWPGFLLNQIIELSARKENMEEAEKILQALHWQFQAVPDIAGMITPRIIATIINEAYFALGDQVSSKEEIDVAMKLGTNYPYGPFEWSQKIGLIKIYNLLLQLSQTDKRYSPAPLLENEIKH